MVNHKGTIALVIEFLHRTVCADEGSFQHDSIARLILHRLATITIIILLYGQCCLLQSGLRFLMRLPHVISELTSCLVDWFPSRVGAAVRVSAIVQEERRLFGRRMLPIVVCELRRCQPLRPVRLPRGDEHSEVVFDFLIDALCLTICLWVIGCRQGALDP